MANCIIVTSKGFVIGCEFDKEKMEQFIKYTDKLREATLFNSKSAKQFIKSKKLDAFIYRPYAEETVKCKYKVVKKPEGGYGVEQTWMNIVSDITFFKYGFKERDDIYSKEEAINIATDKNLKLLEEIEKELKKYKLE